MFYKLALNQAKSLDLDILEELDVEGHIANVKRRYSKDD